MDQFFKTQQLISSLPASNLGAEYWLDAWQRSILFLDTLRRRGNIHQEEMTKEVPNVLEFEHELIIDGRTLERPVNYALARVIPPKGVEIDATRRPFMLLRAGNA